VSRKTTISLIKCNVGLFNDTAFELARHEALENAAMLRRMGEFEPARLGPEEMEYTTSGQILEKLKERFKPA
jgi:fructose 1,6-bisphosphate aldolase/phosphatase